LHVSSAIVYRLFCRMTGCWIWIFFFPVALYEVVTVLVMWRHLTNDITSVWSFCNYLRIKVQIRQRICNIWWNMFDY